MIQLSAPSRWWLPAVLAFLALAAEWLRSPGPLWAWAAAACALGAAGLLRPWSSRWPGRLLAVLLVLAGLLLPASQWRVSALGADWPAEREARIAAASRRLEGDLRADLRRIVNLTGQVAALAPLQDEALFHALDRLITRGGVETGVILFGPDGTPRAWAGEHRLAPEPGGDSLAVRFSPYLSVFETRRHLPDGSVAVASLLLDADASIPGAAASLSDRFRARTEVGLDVYAPGQAPDDGDVFDYEEPTTAGPRVLFSVRPAPPTQGEATDRAIAGASRLVTLLVLGIVVLGTVVAPSPGRRYLLLGGLVWAVLRAPVLEVMGLDLLASPALFYRELPFGLATVAGPLLLLGLLLILLGVRLWREPGRRPSWAVLFGGLLLIGAPYLVRTLGQGITPPVEGVSLLLWLTWEAALLLATAGIVVVSAGLLRGTGRQVGTAWPMLGAVLAIAAAIVGVFAWEGRSGWPDWYTVIWLPALVLVTRPTARWATLLGVAIVAGSAAALMTWGAELEGRVELARRDLMHLGGEPELLAEPLLRGFAVLRASRPVPDGAAALFAAWRGSELDRQGYPARLELRSDSGRVHTAVVLDQLDLPDSVLAPVVRALPPGPSETILTLARAPGLHYLLVQRLAPDTVLMVALGPRTLLVNPARLGRLVHPPALRQSAYRITLSPAAPVAGTETTQVRWRRERWNIRGERTVELPDGPRQAFATVQMLSPAQLVIRGTLVLFLNVVLLGLLWRVAEVVAGDVVRIPARRMLVHSFRAQLFVALGAFFVVPVGVFAVWSVNRLNAEAEQGRRLAVTQTLRDVLSARPDLSLGEDDQTILVEAAERVDAELGIYRGGRLVARTSPVLDAFGMLSPLMDPDAHHEIYLAGQRDATAPGPARHGTLTVGHRSFRPAGSEATAVLASPQAAVDPVLADQQLNLVLALLLACLLGVVAALIGARLAARRLSRPVADLRRAALAFGAGQGMVIPAAEPPVEFQPVFAAFQKMADDVQANQEAQERAARVLAWGEMASQVAHEIKNPLTPMRLGIQHLQRVWKERRDRIGPALEETAPRVLAEIDRLDRIARSFSRYGAPAAEGAGLERVDLIRELSELIPLYRVGEGAMAVEVATTAASPVAARRDEVKEVLLNLLENARNAGARRVVLRAVGRSLSVEDDGHGMAPEMLERIFEPRFSTTTSGSGLGLAIVRRIVEGWGGTIGVISEPGKGTTFTIRFTAAEQR